MTCDNVAWRGSRDASRNFFLLKSVKGEVGSLGRILLRATLTIHEMPVQFPMEPITSESVDGPAAPSDRSTDAARPPPQYDCDGRRYRRVKDVSQVRFIVDKVPPFQSLLARDQPPSVCSPGT
jgi:hypothetical protein